MNREIKYRIWDKKNKEFIDLEYTDRQLSIDPLSGKVMEIEVSTGELDVFVSDWLIPLQYTGLTDNGGKNIYEGDIVKNIEVTNNGMKEYVTPIIWEDASFVMKSGGDDYDTFLASWSGDPNKTYPLFEIEVIGNVFEDSHLLEQTNENTL